MVDTSLAYRRCPDVSVRAILALPFPFPIGPFLGSFPGAFLPSLSPVLAPFFSTPSLPSHIGSSGRHHARIFIGNRGRWSRLDITPIDRAQYAETQKNQQYPCAHDVFLTAFRVLCQSFFLTSLYVQKSCRRWVVKRWDLSTGQPGVGRTPSLRGTDYERSCV